MTPNRTVGKPRIRPEVFEPSSEEEISEQLDSMTNLNQATIDPNDSTCSTYNSSIGEPMDFSRTTYMEDLDMARTYEDDYEIINSTQCDAVVPDLKSDERPIRNRKPPNYYQAS